MNVLQLRLLANRINVTSVYGDTYTALNLCRKLDDIESAGWKYLNRMPEYRTKYEGRPMLEKFSTFDTCVGWKVDWRQLPVENPTPVKLAKAWQCIFTLELYEAEDSFRGYRGQQVVEISWVITDEEHFAALIEKLIEPKLRQQAYHKAERDELAEVDRKHKAAIDRRLASIMHVTEFKG